MTRCGSGPFRTFDLASDVGCAVHDDGSVECWGERKLTESPRFAIEDARAIHVSALGGCAVRANDELKCWGPFSASNESHGCEAHARWR